MNDKLLEDVHEYIYLGGKDNWWWLWRRNDCHMHPKQSQNLQGQHLQYSHVHTGLEDHQDHKTETQGVSEVLLPHPEDFPTHHNLQWSRSDYQKENFCEPWFKWGGPTETWWRIIRKEFKNQGLTANTGCQLSSATPAPPLELSFIGTIFVAWNGRVGQLPAGDIASVWTSGVWFPHWALQFLSSLWVKCVSMGVNIC